jgi:membrane protein implicated in regulation of membrane protease activity
MNNGRKGRSWLVSGVIVALGAAIAVGAVVAVARLASPDVAVIVAPAAATFAVALLVARASVHRRRQLDRLHRRLRRDLDQQDRRQARRARRETSRLYGQLEALAALRDTLDGKLALPSTRDWAASADLLRELVTVILARRPRVVVETGSGTSTVIIAACLQRLGGGHVWSLEHLPRFAGETRALLETRGLSDWATVVDAPLVDVRLGDDTWSWYDLAGYPAGEPIEVLFVDGPPGDTGPLARYPALPMLRDRLASGASILVDDGARPDEQAMVARWRAEVPGLEVRPLPLEKGGSLLTLDETHPTTT